jgi:hypothetical protein
MKKREEFKRKRKKQRETIIWSMDSKFFVLTKRVASTKGYPIVCGVTHFVNLPSTRNGFDEATEVP